MRLLVLQCGGPTPVINASLWGVISASQVEPQVTELWGGRQGWQGLLDGDWVELTHFHNHTPPYLEELPGAALGSGRVPLRAADLPQALARLQARGIHGVLAIGGNGTMAAARRLQQAADAHGYQVDGQGLQVVGIPKTIDNDLVATDFAPGYPSAARFLAQATRDVGLDLWSMRTFDDVAVLEVMGRHAGWLAAATALARSRPEDPPHLVLVPEVSVDEAALLDRIAQVHAREGVCLVVAAEGLRDPQGRFLAERLDLTDPDATGQRLLSLSSGVAAYLAHRVRTVLDLRCRQIRPDLLQRTASLAVSPLDRREAVRVGAAAVDAVVQGVRDAMIGLERLELGWVTRIVSLSEVVGRERTLPEDFVRPMDVTDAFLDYARPLVEPLHRGAVRF